MLFDNLCGEFETAWNTIATSAPEDASSGSFLFTRQVMLLVELASRIAHQDPPTFKRFSHELCGREERLFKRLPYKSGRRSVRRCVPRMAPDGTDATELIEVLFDLLRNGHAHFGHQLYAPLQDGTAFGIRTLGVTQGRTLDKVRANGGCSIDHLLFVEQSDGNLVMWLCAGTLYVDVRDASEAAGVWDLDADATEFTEARLQELTVTDFKTALLRPPGAPIITFTN